jgi:hypothetical protein
MKNIYISCNNEVFSVNDSRDVFVTLTSTTRDCHFTILRDEYNRVLQNGSKIYKLISQPNTIPTTMSTATKPPVVKSGLTKAERAVDIYKSLGAKPSKDVVIAAFIEQLNMTKLGAQTYYYNTKKVVN